MMLPWDCVLQIHYCSVKDMMDQIFADDFGSGGGVDITMLFV